MIISFLLHAYQPPQQNAGVFEEISKNCYLPLIKLLKAKKDFKATVNIPLSTLEWFEKQKMEHVFNDLIALRDAGKIELTGCAAYHPILTKIPNEEVERQIILNEAGLAYYLGRREGFEGEPSLMIKDVKGFFPPEMAFNSELGSLVNELSYDWVVVDEVSTNFTNSADNSSELNHINKLEGTNLHLVVRNRDLSLCLSYQRNADTEAFFEGIKYLSQKGVKHVCVALDIEAFGHHNKEGVELLENIIDEAPFNNCIFANVSKVVEEFKTKKDISVVDASWGAGDEDMKAENPYPKWYIKDNKYHENFEKLEELLLALVTSSIHKFNGKTELLGNIPIWDFNKISQTTELNDGQKSWIKSRILIDKALNSDKYWWSSKLPNFDTNMIKRSLELFVKGYEKLDDADQEAVSKIKEVRDNILGLLKSESGS